MTSTPPPRPWRIAIPGRVIDVEVHTSGPAGSCTSIAHCPGVGHAPGAFSACRTSEDIAVPAAVLLVLREFWLDGVPAVAVPPDAPYTLTPDPTTDDSAAR